MKTILLTALILLTVTTAYSGDNNHATGSITGLVLTWDGIPLVGATVMIIGTSYGAMTDHDGRYLIIRREPGVYDLEAYMVGFDSFEVARDVIVTSGDTTVVDFSEYVPELERYQWSEAENDTLCILVVHLLATDSDSLNGFRIRTMRNEPYKGTFVSRGIYQVVIPLSAQDQVLHWSFPDRAESPLDVDLSDPNSIMRVTVDVSRDSIHQIEPPDLSGLPLSIADQTDYEWVAPGYRITRSVIDPEEWDTDSLSMSGFIDQRVYFDETPEGYNSWRIILVYHEYVVVLSEVVEPQVFPLGVPATREVVFSPAGEYILVFDAISACFRDGDASLLNTRTGETIYFDPTPETPEPVYERPYRGCIRVIGPGPGNVYLPDDNGRLVHIRTDDTIKVFDEGMNLVYAGPFPRTGNVRGCRISPDGERIIVPPDPADSLVLAIHDRTGALLSLTSFNSNWIMACDRGLSVLMGVCPVTGTISAYSGYSGELLNAIQPAGDYHGLDLSPDCRTVCYATSSDSNPAASTFHIWDIDSSTLISEFPNFSELWTGTYGFLLSDSGACLLRMRRNAHNLYPWAPDSRLVLMDEGDPVWISSVRTDIDFFGISPDGSCVVYSDGLFYHTIRISED